MTLSTRVGRRWQIGRQDLRLDLVAKTRGFVTIDALSMIFLLFCLASFFSFFSPPFPAVFSLLLAWSLQQPSAPLQDGNNNNKQQQQQLLDVGTVIFFYMSHQTRGNTKNHARPWLSGHEKQTSWVACDFRSARRFAPRAAYAACCLVSAAAICSSSTRRQQRQQLLDVDTLLYFSTCHTKQETTQKITP